MNLVNFQEEFEKLARSQGMGDVITSGLVCHKARTVLDEIFPEGECDVQSFKDGLLTISFPSSSALARFNMLKVDFEKKMEKSFEDSGARNPVSDIKSTIV